MPGRKKTHKFPKEGTIYKRTFKGKNYALEIVDNGGRIGYKVRGVTYPSPSAAAKSITDTEVNGWAFWKID